MGLPVHKINLGNSNKGWKEELKMANKDTIVFGYSRLDNPGDKEPKRIKLPSGNDSKDDTITFEGVQTKNRTRLSLPDLKRIFS